MAHVRALSHIVFLYVRCVLYSRRLNTGRPAMLERVVCPHMSSCRGKEASLSA